MSRFHIVKFWTNLKRFAWQSVGPGEKFLFWRLHFAFAHTVYFLHLYSGGQSYSYKVTPLRN
jgi:hypothetical protein